jgi:hypothetical protein
MRKHWAEIARGDWNLGVNNDGSVPQAAIDTAYLIDISRSVRRAANALEKLHSYALTLGREGTASSRASRFESVDASRASALIGVESGRVVVRRGRDDLQA